MGSVNAILTKRDGVTPLFDETLQAFPFVQHDPAGNPIGLGPVGPRKRARGFITPLAAVVPIPVGTKVAKVACTVLARLGVGSLATVTGSTQQRQTFTGGDATSGNFTAGFQGQVSGNIAYNTSGANLVTALVAESSIGAGGVTLISGGPLNTTPIVIEFASGIIDGDQPLIIPTTVDLAGGASANSRLPVVTISTPAATFTGFGEANSEFLIPLNATDAYIYIKGDDATAIGKYRCSWLS